MQWAQLLSTRRFAGNGGGEENPAENLSAANTEAADASRTDFHIDYDRVVFSGSFRRLGRKTQVHPFAELDMTHNRLTHSVEVASVGRSIGNRVGMMLAARKLLPKGYTPSDIGTVVQVACLAHDMGNPPFGHIGEEALRHWFCAPENARYLQDLTPGEIKDIQTYEGNAHTLRIVAGLEMYGAFGGMRLTSAAVGTLMKYPWSSSAPQCQKGKFNIYQTEMPFIRAVAQELGLPEKGANAWARHPLSYLMEAADDICYAVLDLEDAVELNILGDAEFEEILSSVAGKPQDTGSPPHRQRRGMLRGRAIGHAVESVAAAFIRHHDDLLAGSFTQKDLIEAADEDVRAALLGAKAIARERVFHHKSKLMTEIAAFPCLGSILDLLVPAVYAKVRGGKEAYSARDRLALILLEDDAPADGDTLYTAYMKILDFVGGMTDNAAAKMAREVSGIGMIR